MPGDNLYAVARAVAPGVAAQLERHREGLAGTSTVAGASRDLQPEPAAISTLVDAAFWASLKREEGFVPTISLAYLPPDPSLQPLTFARPLPLDAASLARLGPAVEQPGIHIGVWWHDERLMAWGTTRHIPPLCFVVEVVAPGHIVLKHRPRHESRKFVNLAVIEGDTAKVIDERASLMPGCPALLTGLLGGDGDDRMPATQVLVELAVSMRSHRRGGTLIVVSSRSDAWLESMVTPIAYAVEPAFAELSSLLGQTPNTGHHDGPDALRRTVQSIAGLTAVDGATILSDRYALLAFGAKIRRRQGSPQVDQLLLTEPVVGNVPTRVSPSQLGGTRHLSAAQFISDQKEGLVLVASQDGRFTLFAWSPVAQAVHAHRIDVLLV